MAIDITSAYPDIARQHERERRWAALKAVAVSGSALAAVVLSILALWGRPGI
ncbi:hypothetical protein ITJ64_03530 [Herbiconiux sp. VKM Ac-1786]|jgi:hypothetical protein|uniref:hypothetical protein n=1 Tax=Herbiconiux sp. VKM Ac-1786 TaxID=2783824 RepID=UPI00188D7D6D|nr:hypothetical protein [Herbiconiux sp. VKM Ac-1786]MBF4571578.1 hypothetical protein [Herbiconiux sp. VKM Ac-1786]